MALRCGLCGGSYLLWADGYHHDERHLDLWHDVEVDLVPSVDWTLLPPEMRPPHMRDSEPQAPPSLR